MQLALIKRYSHGFTITDQLHAVESRRELRRRRLIPYDQPQDRVADWGPLDQDHRHRFTTSWVLDLPGGNMAGPLKHVIGGWQWTGVMQFQTGRPFTVNERHGQFARRHRQRPREAHRSTGRAAVGFRADGVVQRRGIRRERRRHVRQCGQGRLLRAEPAELGHGAVQELPHEHGHERAVPRGVLQRLQPGQLRHPEHEPQRRQRSVSLREPTRASAIRASSSSV